MSGAGLTSLITGSAATPAVYNIVVGNTTYTVNVAQSYAVNTTSIVVSVPGGAPALPQLPASGTLTYVSGTGPASIVYTAQTPGNWYFNMAATSGAAATAAGSTVSNFTMLRALGIATNQFSLKTSTVPAFTLGALLTSNSVGYAKPVSAPANTNLNGTDCLFAASTTGLYMGKISDLSSYGYTFTVTSANATAGAVYLNNGAYFTVNSTIAAGTSLSCMATGAPSGSGTLVKVSGTGDATITFSTSAVQGGTWASMTPSGVNITGTGIDIVAPSGSLYAYSGENSSYDFDRWVYVTNTSTYVMKPYQNSNITEVFGGITNTYYETLNPITTQFGATALTGIDIMGGWLFSCSSGIGQRGIVFGDLWSDAQFGNSGVISPVLSVPAGSIFKEIDTIEQLFNYTDSMNFWIRSAATSTDASFNSGTLPVGSPTTIGTTSNGWTSIQTASDLSTISIGPYFQLCVTFQIATLLANTPAQVNDLKYAVVTPLDSSDYWEGSVDNTTQNGATPAYTAFRMTQAYGAAYSSVVPTLYFRAYDDNGNLVASANTSANPTSFQYTTNNGSSWTNLGTIANTALTTEVRYIWATPPGVRVTCSIRES